MLVPIASADDPHLAPYRGVKERDLIRSAGRFIVEGQVTLGKLVEGSRFPVESLFLAESRVGPLAGILAKLDPEIPVFVAPQAVMDAITGFHIHRGVLAVARRESEPGVKEFVARLAR